MRLCTYNKDTVGMVRFEPTTSRTLNECASRTAPHPETTFKVKQKRDFLNILPLLIASLLYIKIAKRLAWLESNQKMIQQLNDLLHVLLVDHFYGGMHIFERK